MFSSSLHTFVCLLLKDFTHLKPVNPTPPHSHTLFPTRLPLPLLLFNLKKKFTVLLVLMSMMMIHRQHPTVEVPPWDSPYEDPTTPMFSPQTNEYFSALKRFLPSSEYDDSDSESSDLPFDAFTCDNFRMYEFKIRKCSRGRSHDWTECPYAHPGEKARRRDPRKYHYSGTACPDFRRGSCRKGDSCEFSHGVFECWLHPARYRTQPCKDGPHCKRRVCFFAHSPDQLRVLPSLPDSPPSRLGGDSLDSSSPPARRLVGYSPTSVFETSFSESPPRSPSYGVNELASAMRELQIKKLGMGSTQAPRWAGLQMGSPSSPRGGYVGPSVNSLPTTPTTQAYASRDGRGLFDPWADEEVPMERVESGKDLRARMYAKLSRENSLGHDQVDTLGPGPDFGWVSELVK